MQEDCNFLGECNQCYSFRYSLKLTDNKILHYDECYFTVNGDFLIRHLIAHDGRLWHIREDLILWERENVPSLEEFLKNKDIQEKSKKEETFYE